MTVGQTAFTGGAGNDVFDIDADGTSTAMAMIQDMAAGDTIDLVDVDDADAGIADGALGCRYYGHAWCWRYVSKLS